MFTPDFYIDSIQDGKKIVINKLITDPMLNKLAQDYVNAQTAFAKNLVHTFIEFAKTNLDSTHKVLFPQTVEITKAARAKAAKAETAAAQPTDTNTQGDKNV